MRPLRELAAPYGVAGLHADFTNRTGQLRGKNRGVGRADRADCLVELRRGLPVRDFSLYPGNQRPGFNRALPIGSASGKKRRR